MSTSALLSLLGIDADSNDEAELLRKLYPNSEHPEQLLREQWDQLWPLGCVSQCQGNDMMLTCWLTQEELSGHYRLTIDNEQGYSTELAIDIDITATHHEPIRAQAGCQRCYRYDVPLEALPAGRYRLQWQQQDQFISSGMLLILPNRGFMPPSVQNQSHFWGLRTQLSALRSARNWGVGDLTDLYTLVESTSRLGAQAVFMMPLADTASAYGLAHLPYLASHRNFLHIAYLDVERIDEFEQCDIARQQVRSSDFQQLLHRMQEQETVDWPAICGAKRNIVELLYQHFVDHEFPHHTLRARRFNEFLHHGGSELYQYCLFQALQEQLQQEGLPADWRRWPDALQQTYSDQVAERATTLQPRIGFYQYLQWQLTEQYRRIGKLMWESSSTLGLIPTLSLSLAPNSAEVWAEGELYARAFHLAPECSSLRLTAAAAAMQPWVLRQRHYQPLYQLLSQSMINAGAVLLTDLSALLQPRWQYNEHPDAAPISLTTDISTLIGVIADASHQHHCLVIIDDQPQWSNELRAALLDADFLLYNSLQQQYNEQTFPRYNDLLAQSVVTFAADYEPTLKGFWSGADLTVQGEAPLPAEQRQHYLERATARTALLLALDEAQLLPASLQRHLLGDQDYPASLTHAVYQFLSSSPARWVAVNLADLFGSIYQPGLPLTDGPELAASHKYPQPIERLFDSEPVWQIAEMLSNRTPQTSGTIRATESPLDSTQVPRATYRMQLQPSFTLADAQQQLGYLQQLGISHLYTSPLLEARSGSQHGYDVTNHTRINPEIGGDAAFDVLHHSLCEHDMGLLLDIVPNHMVVMGSANQWWQDVLENGPASIYADYFDIEWQPLNEALHNKVLIPVLGERYGQILVNRELALHAELASGQFYIRYYDHTFPLDPSTLPAVINYQLTQLEAAIGASSPQMAELNALLDALAMLPPSTSLEDSIRLNRRNNAMVHKKRLAQLCQENNVIAQYLQSSIDAINDEPDLATLHLLLEQQNYRLAYWRTASDEINYRRFFDINELAGLRMENYRAFEDAHRYIFNLIEQEKVQGIRIDHSDGLNNPSQYFQWLAKRFTTPLSTRWLYIVTEKILAPHEPLPDTWPIDGTSGYDYLFLINGLMVDYRAQNILDSCYKHFIGYASDYEQLLYLNKKRVMDSALASELNMLAKRLSRLLQQSPMTRDFPQSLIREALKEVIACFPVYRTYIHTQTLSQQDSEYLDVAIALARRRAQFDDRSIFDVLHQVFALELPQHASEIPRKALLDVVMSWQQLTSPVMAKGAEDTSFYLYNRLVSLNEVGAEPTVFGIEPEEYHCRNQQRALQLPHTMLCTSTHDTKRSEDVRCRIAALSELADTWQEHIHRWHHDNVQFHLTQTKDSGVPSANDCYLLYQTLLGTWPLDLSFEREDREVYIQRIQEYMIKAAREAKQNTNWLNPDEQYETALTTFSHSCICAENQLFQQSFLPFLRRVIRLGMCNSLSTVVLKYCAPGVPDLYQGNELWDYSLVDPDNRRPVDYALRKQWLSTVTEAYAQQPRSTFLAELLATADDGRIKLFLTWLLLQLRLKHSALFCDGTYDTLSLSGTFTRQAVVSRRRNEAMQLVVVAPRLVAALSEHEQVPEWPLGPLWQDTELQPEEQDDDELLNILDGKSYRLTQPLPLSTLLQEFPWAVLISRSALGKNSE